MAKLVVVDGNSLLFRGFYATYRGKDSPIMRNKDGVPTNAIFAFANMLSKVVAGLQSGDYLFVAFDADSQTFRKEELSSYKANRAPCPEELKPQFPISREMLTSMGVFYYELHGFEADDLAGTVASLGEKAGLKVDIYTSDKDYLQLVSPVVSVELMKVGLSNIVEVTPENIVSLFGYTATQTVDFKGLRGDASDNLSGIPGIGEKGAVKLLAKYGTFENIVAHAEEIGGKTGKAILEHQEEGRLSYRLAKIKRDVELPFGLGDLLYRGYDGEEASRFAAKYDLRTYVAHLPSSWRKEKESEKAEILPKTALSSILSKEKVGIYVDLGSELYHDAEIFGMAFSDGEGAVYLSKEDIASDLEEIKAFFSSQTRVYAYSVKELAYVLHRLGIDFLNPYEDLLSGAYLLSPDIAQKKEAAYASLSLPYHFDAEKREESSSSLAREALLFDNAIARLKEEGLFALYENVERPLALVLERMEEEGVPLKKEVLKKLGDAFAYSRDKAEEKVDQAAGGEKVNLNSPKQIAGLLFDRLGLPNIKKGSTSVDVLKELAKSYPIAEDILTYRKYAKLVSTYVEGLLPHLAEDGKIHTYFNQALTATGRLSSSEPNLQNIASKDEEGSLVKEAFLYEDGSYFLSLDYSQIELRVLASMSGSKAYIETFERGIDVHEETARRIFHVESPTHLERRKAKAVNFAVVYGSTAFGLSEQIGCSPSEASALVNDFYEHYPEVKSYLDGAVEFAIKHGYCTTMFGRRRYLPDLHSPKFQLKEAARRQAMNAPIQGTAADIIKMAMLKVDSLLKEGGYRTKMVLQIHDELIFKVPEDEKEAVYPLLKKAMEGAASLKVPLVVAGGYGKTWKEAKD